jgi:hypothetical protein
MANKIYDFLPGHLKNKELETIFDATLERVFSKGDTEKVRAFIGRREKGIYKNTDSYINYPVYSYARKNYAFEPVYSNSLTNDNVFYDDFLNALYNKGALTNDHRRLLYTAYNTINLPIDADKFVNWQMYYWVSPNFDASTTGSNDLHYVTIDKGASNWWSENNSWYHYDDIRELITNENSQFIIQAKRPIIEFDNRLELSDESQSVTSFVEPKFNVYLNNEIIMASKIFGYVTGDYAFDPVLQLNPKLQSGDYVSEFVFKIDMYTDTMFKIDGELTDIYIESNFKYRNFREEYNDVDTDTIELLNRPESENTIDIYVDGNKMIGGYNVYQNTITFDEAIATDYMYIDYCTKYNVEVDGDGAYQRTVPSVEFNVDNSSHLGVELSYTSLYEHFVRIIETSSGLEGAANGVNNYRLIGDNSDKLRSNDQGSVIITSTGDISDVYFAFTRDDYNPFEALEFISSSYSSFKNKLISVANDIINEPGSYSKSTSQILEEAIREISRTKKSTISLFENIGMINIGSKYSHYEEVVFEVVANSAEQFIPDMDNPIIDDKTVSVYVDGELQILYKDYYISYSGNTINFINFVPTNTTEIVLRNYIIVEEAYIPPSATKLGIAPVYVPEIVTDNEYSNPVQFIVGHDGSKTPVWGNRLDDILLDFEKRVFNKIENFGNTTITHMDYLSYWDADWDYSFGEKNYTLYPFFKKWMLKNNINDMFNSNFDLNDWKTWNYKSINDTSPGNWRGMFEYVYGTDQLFVEPWKILKQSQKPENFDVTYGTDYTTVAFWTALIADAGIPVPVPVDDFGTLKTPNELFFNNSITSEYYDQLSLDWEFGDGSPEEFAWRRSSEFPFIAFIGMMLLKPMEILSRYETEIENTIRIFSKRDGINVDNVINSKNNYEFKLGSKLAGFVNNLKVFTENTSLSNSRFTSIPEDSYKLKVHKGEPNRSEFYSAIVIEKVSLDTSHPAYDTDDLQTYTKGTVVLNTSDKKYYRRKLDSLTQKEIDGTVNFDYSAWTLVSQPKTREYGYRIHGYDEFNPVFYTLDWDTTSGRVTYNTSGDPLDISSWMEGTYYRLDEYVVYNGQPYVCLRSHTATTIFDDNIEDWKQVKTWPSTNVVTANGYSELQLDQVRTYNYGDILKTIDEVAHLFIGYEGYLRAIGWNFTDVNDNDSSIIDFKTLLLKFLDWTTEERTVGEFITLTPLLLTGEFSAPYGVATVQKETYKNFYRVLDSDGRLIQDSEINFYSDGEVLRWESTRPIYGMKIDIRDVEHAIVFDRVDGYGDVIFDPVTHNRNLRFTIDCNRTKNWDGTLAADGYLLHNDKMIPNLETITNDSRFYRDTFVDQNLDIVNKLKERQIGFTPRTYLDNFYVERESQLEFYKGFIAAKGTNSSIKKIINNNSNYVDIHKSEVWAMYIEEFGRKDTNRKVSTSVKKSEIVNDPFTVTFEMNTDAIQLKDNPNHNAIVKTTGYVDSKFVNYVASAYSDLERLNTQTLYEGDIAWLQFDEEREWDVRRLSEIAEINYIGETSDGQLYIVLTNKLSTLDSVYIKILSSYVDPSVDGYYYLIEDGELYENGLTVYKYLVFETNFEPLIVEIDQSSSDSVYSPTPGALGVEAIGSKSKPNIIDGDTLVINGESYSYDADAVTGGSIFIQGEVTNPYVQSGESIRISIYDYNGQLVNDNNVVQFSSLNVVGTNAVTSSVGDKILIDGVELTINPSFISDIEVLSTADYNTNILSGETIIVDGTTVTVDILSMTGTTTGYTIDTTRPLQINGFTVEFIPNTSKHPDSATTKNSIISPVQSLVIDDVPDISNYTPGDITVTTSTGSVTLTTADYSWVESTNTIVFNTQIEDTDGLVDFYIELIGNTTVIPFTINDMIDEINLVTGITGVTASNVGGAMHLEGDVAILQLEGSIIVDLGFSTVDTVAINKFDQIANDLSNIAGITASVTTANKLFIQSSNTTMVLSGTALSNLGISSGTYEQTVNPTASSIADQINSIGISGVTASTLSGNIQIIKDGASISIVESVSTPGSMSRLGFTATTISMDSIDQIVSDINEQAFDNNTSNGYAYITNDTVVITSPNRSASLSNIVGNALSDIGILPGTYTSGSTSNVSYISFKDQINAVATDIQVSVTSDGRMVFTSSDTSMSFFGTDQSILDKIGLYVEYSSVTSNPNFKIMRWKSVRYTPNFNGFTFDEFYAELGLNDESYIWTDAYNDSGWHVLKRGSDGSLSVVARQASVVDTARVNRLIIKDGENFKQYNVFDPINGIIPGDISKKIKYTSWKDPAKYEDTSFIDKWMDEHVGELWWDTDQVRYYRYHDYGDKLGNISIPYIKKYWGRMVPGSIVTVKRWTKSTILPTNVTKFNQKSYYDAVQEKNVSVYYYWTTNKTIAGDVNDYSAADLKSILESDIIDNKFIPVNTDTILVSNKVQSFVNEDLEFTIEYSINNGNDNTSSHKEWELFSESNEKLMSEKVWNNISKSIIGMEVTYSDTIIVEQFDLDQDPEYLVFYNDMANDGGSTSNIVISNNNSFIHPDRILFDFGKISIKKYENDIIDGDIVRIYRIDSNIDNMFAFIDDARSNFSSVMNEIIGREMISTFVPDWREYLSDELIVSLTDWALTEKYKNITKYEYLSKTRDFDMISLYNNGVNSFKVETDVDEYFFVYNNQLRLVNRSNSVMNINTSVEFDDDAYISYYTNAVSIQLYELFNIINHYFNNADKKKIALTMIEYVMSENTDRTMDIFKTSNIDLEFEHRQLKQHAIYQRDSYQDLIDYVNETKPYHTKIRNVKVRYPLDESLPIDVTSSHHKTLGLMFGTTTDYTVVVDTDFISNPTINNVSYLFNPKADINDLVVYVDGKLLDDKYYYFNDGNLYFNTNYDIFETDDAFAVRMDLVEGQVITVTKTLSRYDIDVADGNGTDAIAFDCDAAYLLKLENEYTSDSGGVDAGLVPTRARESVFVKVENFTDETRTVSDSFVFFVYDQLGRSYKVSAEHVGSISDFSDDTLIVGQGSSFDEVDEKSKKMIILENENGYEFMMYNNKSGTALTISDRKLFNGIGYTHAFGDSVYSVKSITMI